MAAKIGKDIQGTTLKMEKLAQCELGWWGESRAVTRSGLDLGEERRTDDSFCCCGCLFVVW